MQYRNRLITSFPAGYAFGGDKAKRAMTGKRMKDMGYLIGIPDIFIPEPVGKYPGLFIELKVGKNTTTDSQDNVLEELSRRGYKVAVIALMPLSRPLNLILLINALIFRCFVRLLKWRYSLKFL